LLSRYICGLHHAEDLSRVPVERLREVSVAMMVVGGAVVYGA
jgi:hypothetical protein